MRISRATFERFKEERIIICTGSGLTSNSYSVNPSRSLPRSKRSTFRPDNWKAASLPMGIFEAG
ncbi:MAG: hypothetical protein IKE42_05295 [Aquamicrobium sp.]|uniref:hypothetical protein n=1 Tax=Mesorhizobium sp. Pch-S TaxID=2082387 RepID=UPI0010127D21|nr:hypothetical protein [Mesorhizobium sp. Pch-S]MBR2687246.1 hypothetical protein [Aquamicrobium sp.]QAZ44971.1 hypothetical protein C1M53_20585 [Mesorhizobium sp. Pch-S]